jgi:hypothetical protein
MKTLNRLLLLLLAFALVLSSYAMHAGITHATIGHENTYTYNLKWPWLANVREFSLYAVLVWSFLFVRSQPVFVRIGLVSVILAFVIMALPPKVMHEIPTPPGLH